MVFCLVPTSETSPFFVVMIARLVVGTSEIAMFMAVVIGAFSTYENEVGTAPAEYFPGDVCRILFGQGGDHGELLSIRVFRIHGVDGNVLAWIGRGYPRTALSFAHIVQRAWTRQTNARSMNLHGGD